jgi:hypothetical protein
VSQKQGTVEEYPETQTGGLGTICLFRFAPFSMSFSLTVFWIIMFLQELAHCFVIRYVTIIKNLLSDIYIFLSGR